MRCVVFQFMCRVVIGCEAVSACIALFSINMCSFYNFSMNCTLDIKEIDYVFQAGQKATSMVQLCM